MGDADTGRIRQARPFGLQDGGSNAGLPRARPARAGSTQPAEAARDARPERHKYFATIQLLRLATDQGWLDRATKLVSRTWKIKNAKKRGKGVEQMQPPSEGVK